MNRQDQRKKKICRNILIVIGAIGLTLFIGCLLTPTPAHAEELSPVFSLNSSSCTMFSKDVGSNGGVFYDKNTLQCSAGFSGPAGFSGGVWIGRGEGPWMQEDFGDEVDLNFGRSGKIGTIDWDLRVAYFFVYHPGGSGRFADVLNPTVEVSKTFDLGGMGNSVTVYGKFEHYLPAWGATPGSGQIVRLGVTQALPGWKADTSVKAEVFYDTGAFGNDSGVLGDVSITVLKRFGSFSAGPTVKYYTPLSSLSDGRKGEVAIGLVVSK
jgi:hypothetical protein